MEEDFEKVVKKQLLGDKCKNPVDSSKMMSEAYKKVRKDKSMRKK